uniref:Uncharacterized protein n=1 Tax=viral metagenome TaxID=1070528 RepID=A0A2V0RKV8_9ZZZZ
MKQILSYARDNVLNPTGDGFPTVLFVVRKVSVFSEGSAVATQMGEAVNRVRYAFLNNSFRNSYEIQEAIELLDHLPVMLGKSLAIAHQRELMNNVSYLDSLVNSDELNFSEQNALRVYGTVSNSASITFDNAIRDYCLPAFLIDLLLVTATVIKSDGCGETAFVIPLMTNPIDDGMMRAFSDNRFCFTSRLITDFIDSVTLSAPEKRLSMLLQEHLDWTQLQGVGTPPNVDSPSNVSALLNSAISFNHGFPNLNLETANSVVTKGKLLMRTSARLDVDDSFSFLVNTYIDSRKIRQGLDSFKEEIIPVSDSETRFKWTILAGVRFGGREKEIFYKTYVYPGICQSSTYKSSRYFHVDMGLTGANTFNSGITPRLKGVRSLNSLLKDKFGQHIQLETPNSNVNLHRMATTFQASVDVEDHFNDSLKDLANILLPRNFGQKAYAGAPSVKAPDNEDSSIKEADALP